MVKETFHNNNPLSNLKRHLWNSKCFECWNVESLSVKHHESFRFTGYKKYRTYSVFHCSIASITLTPDEIHIPFDCWKGISFHCISMHDSCFIHFKVNRKVFDNQNIAHGDVWLLLNANTFIAKRQTRWDVVIFFSWKSKWRKRSYFRIETVNMTLAIDCWNWIGYNGVDAYSQLDIRHPKTWDMEKYWHSLAKFVPLLFIRNKRHTRSRSCNYATLIFRMGIGLC